MTESDRLVRWIGHWSGDPASEAIDVDAYYPALAQHYRDALS